MKITIKNLKVSEFASEETLCFEASVYVDGSRSFTVSNNGHGGDNFYHGDREKIATVSAWAKTQPRIELDGVEGGSYECSIDHVIDEAIEAVRDEKWLKRQCKKKTLIRLVGDDVGKWHAWPYVFDSAMKAFIDKEYGDTVAEIANERFVTIARR